MGPRKFLKLKLKLNWKGEGENKFYQNKIGEDRHFFAPIFLLVSLIVIKSPICHATEEIKLIKKC